MHWRNTGPVVVLVALPVAPVAPGVILPVQPGVVAPDAQINNNANVQGGAQNVQEEDANVPLGPAAFQCTIAGKPIS